MPRIPSVAPDPADVLTHTYLANAEALANGGLRADQKGEVA